MKSIFDKRIAARLAVLVLASLAVTPAAGARGGGGAGASNRQVDNSRQDARTNEVRGTSVNNVNASRNTNVSSNTNINSSRNVNVNVDSNNGCCGNGWDNDHPVAAAAVVTAVVVGIGTRVAAPPPNCVPVNRGGIVYQQCGSTWYQPQGGQYVVVAPPP